MTVKKQKILIALSGGVDSSTTAALLKKQGFECTAVFMKLWGITNPVGLKRAKASCRVLGIPLQVVDFRRVFKKQVVDSFIDDYGRGLTPNPCVVCNQEIKFGWLFDYMKDGKFDCLATGHYVNNVFLNKSYHLTTAKDLTKDQSYFLYRLTQKQLKKLIFPLGGVTKNEVRKLAAEFKLPTASAKDSQEICFIENQDYRSFLKTKLKNMIIPGQLVDGQKRVIGSHQGLPLYTIGQRHGFTLTSSLQSPVSKLIPPFYVIGKDIVKNQLMVGFGRETEQKGFFIEKPSWVNQEPKTRRLLVRVRYQGKLLDCRLERENKDLWRVRLDESVRGVAPGQSAVFYRPFVLKGEKTNEVIGGGLVSLR